MFDFMPQKFLKRINKVRIKNFGNEYLCLVDPDRAILAGMIYFQYSLDCKALALGQDVLNPSAIR